MGEENGTNFGSVNRSGSDGTISGSGSDGSDGSINGSGRGVDGSGGNGNGNGSDTGTDAERGIDSINPNDGDTFGDQNAVNSGADFGTGTGTARGFGDAVRDRITSDSADGGNSGTETLNSEQFAFGLGKKQTRRPKNSANKDSTRTVSARETKELISVFIGTVFEIPALMLKADFWRLSDAENETITNALVMYIDSLPKAKGNKFTKWLSENMPLVNLALVGFFVLGDKVKQTTELLKARKIEAMGENFANMHAPQPDQNNRSVVTPLDVNATAGMVF